MCEQQNFSSAQEELEYWKNLAKDYKQSLEETKEELEEFQVSSRELEAELEAQLEQVENKNRDLTSANARLQMELESLREKLELIQHASHHQITELQDEHAQVKAFKDELQRYIRELEQSNDDLERAKRATVVSLEDFEQRLNLAIERNAFLENELEERDTLSVTVQRLKDESRDLKNELAVQRKDERSAPPQTPESLRRSSATKPIDITDNKPPPDFSTSTPTQSPGKANLMNHAAGNSTPLTPSARISALNIVGDLLRKVGALESKLASCRTFVNSQPRSNKAGASSPLNSPRAKKFHRGGLANAGSAPSVPNTAAKQGLVQITV